MSPAGASSSSVSIALTRSYALAVDDHELLLDAEGVARTGEAMLHGARRVPGYATTQSAGPVVSRTRAGRRRGTVTADPQATNGSTSTVATAEMTTTRLEELLGDDADSLLNHRCETIDAADLHLPGPDFVDRVWVPTRPLPAGPAQPPEPLRPRAPGRHRLRLDPARRPGHRALGGRELRAEPDLLRPREHREARDRGRLQRRRLDGRRARRGRAEVRAPDPVHRQAQPQRAAHLPEQVRPDRVRVGRPRLRPGRGRGRRDDLLRLRRRAPRDHRDRPGLRARARARHVHRAVVLPAQQRLQGRRRRLPRVRRPDRPGQPPGRDDPGRHHQAEAAGEQRRLPRAEQRRRLVRQDEQARLREAHDRPPDRPVPLPGGQLLHGPRRAHQLRRRVVRARPTWPRRSRPRSSTSAPAAPA